MVCQPPNGQQAALPRYGASPFADIPGFRYVGILSKPASNTQRRSAQRISPQSKCKNLSRVKTPLFALPLPVLRGELSSSDWHGEDARCINRSFSPHFVFGFVSWGVAPGWNEDAPLARKKGHQAIARDAGGFLEGQSPASIPAQASGLGLGICKTGRAESPIHPERGSGIWSGGNYSSWASRKPSSWRMRVGWRIFLRAFASICRMRSRVTLNWRPTSSSVRL